MDNWVNGKKNLAENAQNHVKHDKSREISLIRSSERPMHVDGCNGELRKTNCFRKISEDSTTIHTIIQLSTRSAGGLQHFFFTDIAWRLHNVTWGRQTGIWSTWSARFSGKCQVFVENTKHAQDVNQRHISAEQRLPMLDSNASNICRRRARRAVPRLHGARGQHEFGISVGKPEVFQEQMNCWRKYLRHLGLSSVPHKFRAQDIVSHCTLGTRLRAKLRKTLLIFLQHLRKGYQEILPEISRTRFIKYFRHRKRLKWNTGNVETDHRVGFRKRIDTQNQTAERFLKY